MNTMVDEEYQFSKHGLIEKNIEEYRDYSINENDDQFIVLVVGDTGTSKTSLSLLLEHYLTRGDVDLDSYDMQHQDFIQDYTSRPREKIIVYEEGRNSFDKNKFNHSDVAEARDKINQFRKFHHTVFINFQNPNHLTREIVRNAHCLLRTPSKGVMHFYSRQKVKAMWDGNTFRGWKDYNFRDFFPDPAEYVPDTWRRYEEKALEALDEKGVDQDSSEEESQSYLKPKEAGDRIGVSSSTIRRYCDDEKLICKKLPNGQRRITESSLEDILE